ncbi:MAG: DUF2752 domain-containing protein [Ruminococcus sp.]|nr:DUF2752 domain-containing protein [Ruminococcus sp.]
MTGIVLTVSVGLLYYAVVRIFDIGISCPFRTVTGLCCPGCGTSRMAVALLQLDFKGAFYAQPVLFCFLIPLAVCFTKMGIDYVKTGNKDLCLWQNIIVYCAIACLLIYCVYVNIEMLIK